MIVSVEGLDVLVLVRRIPEFDGEVRGAGYCRREAEDVEEKIGG